MFFFNHSVPYFFHIKQISAHHLRIMLRLYENKNQRMLVCSASVLLKYWLTFSCMISSNFPCTIGPMINQLKHDCQSRSCMLLISALLLFIPKVIKNLSQGIFMKLYVAKHIKGGKFTLFQRKINGYVHLPQNVREAY